VPKESAAAVIRPLAVGLALAVAQVAAAGPLPAEFAYLRDVDPTIIQDIRYATAANFTGAPVPGYSAGECILQRRAAEALKLVQADLKPQRLSLKVYDCYRPVRAVKAFMLWVKKPASGAGEASYWPRTQHGDLVKLGYIAARSIHSTGAAVDLTIVALPPAPIPAFDRKSAYGPCNGARAARAPDNGVDMGTGFDCFDPMSSTASEEITDEQSAHRRLLARAMAARGFKNYPREWWHFTYTQLPRLPSPQDFAITK
jgi:D-alanyl-D-alanine dipeptidase